MESVNNVGAQVAIPFLGDPGRLPEGMMTKLRYRRQNKIIVHSKKISRDRKRNCFESSFDHQ